MHNQTIGSAPMDTDNQAAQDSSYGNESWVDMNAYSSQSTMPSVLQTTMPEYGSGSAGAAPFVYMGSMPHGLPSESIGRMPPPPPPPSRPTLYPSQASHPPLPMLLTPSAPQWPSMLTNPSAYTSQQVSPPMAIPSAALPPKSIKPPSLQTNSQPRRTLTDDDRKRMCQYAEDHPSAKQTEIGALFGVERRYDTWGEGCALNFLLLV
jgi:hypothetical protein